MAKGKKIRKRRENKEKEKQILDSQKYDNPTVIRNSHIFTIIVTQTALKIFSFQNIRI